MDEDGTSDSDIDQKIDDHDDDDGGGDDDGNSGDDYDNGDDHKPKRKIDPKILNDASEERTVFVRNLSFSTASEALNEVMVQFGPTVYCKICVDPLTEHSKGSAFIKFENKEDADKCIKASEEESDQLYLDGRQLNVLLAVTKTKLKDIQESRLTKDKDKRNLYLAKEGLIYPNSPAAEGVSQTDLAKRLALETRKRKMLQNNHFFVSKNRLCIHNLPPNFDRKQLKKLFIKAVNDKSAQIVEAIVMFDRRKSDQKFGKSKGFGFVQFTQHNHALKALRHLNNNPKIFTPQKRPIVEFSIENKVAINKKMRREQNNVQKQTMSQTGQQGTAEEQTDTRIDYSGVQSRPNKLNDKIKAPKVNRKLGEMQKHLKNRKKKIHMKKVKESNEKRHKQKVEKRKSNKKVITETQDSHDLHYKKRKNIFRDSDNNKSVPVMKKRAKWFSE